MRLLTRFAVLIATFTTVTNAFKASFTNYGAGDSFGSGSCTQNVGACGHNDPGFTAAISQQQFGVGPGAGAGPACGTCYELTLQTDFAGAKVPSKTITVMIDNLCPIDGNPLCNVPNQYGATANFDLCLGSGAPAAFFPGGSGSGLGTAESVPCTGGSSTPLKADKLGKSTNLTTDNNMGESGNLTIRGVNRYW